VLKSCLVVHCTLNGLGAALTSWRLVERARKKKLGIDDAFAAVVLVIAVLYVVSFELRIKPGMANYTRVGSCVSLVVQCH
jgi:hypothetical protein